VDWVRHGNLGQRRKWALNQRVRRKIVKLAKRKYAGFNGTHLWEELAEQEAIDVSRETVRRVLCGAGLASPQNRRAKEDRARRQRRPRFGEMALVDASRHDWLAGRGPAMALVGLQNDPTGRILAARSNFGIREHLRLCAAHAGDGRPIRDSVKLVPRPAR